MNQRGRKKILVVEDDQDARIYLSSILGSGVEIIEAVDGDEGMKKALSLHPDLIILDVMISDKGGILMYRRLKHDPRLRGVPVILLSAIEKETFFRYQIAENVLPGQGVPEPEAFLEKPPEADELLDVVDRLTRSRPKPPPMQEREVAKCGIRRPSRVKEES
ncbi:MAG: response regulator [Desulfobacterales bacterium]|nr:response regulator [Desulfobacterales bacterium]